MNEIMKKKMSGVYIPPAKLKMLQDSITDKSSKEYQRLSWEALKKSINGLVNKTNASNLPVIVRELLKENLIRGAGVLCQSLLTAQAFGPIFSNVYSALVAVINTKIPQIGKILVSRLIDRYRRSFLRNDKQTCNNAARFIAHLINQDVVHVVLGLEMLTLLLENPSNDSVEIAVGFLKECGAKLQESCPKGLMIIFDMLRNVLNEGNLDTRVQYAIEVVLAIRKDGFKDYPIVIPELDILEEGDKITHEFELDDKLEIHEELNVFRFDPDYLENEEKYSILKKEVLDESSSDEDGDGDDDEDEDDEEDDSDGENEGDSTKVIDETATDLVSLRRKLYLTLQSSLQPEEAAHKLMKLQLEGKDRTEMCFTIIDCCAQQRTYIKFYGLIAQNFCAIANEYVSTFSSVFVDCFSKIHRFQDPNKLRNVAKFFAHLLISDSIPWTVLSCIKLNEEDTTSASRVFIKHLFQEMSDFLGIKKLEARIKDPTLQEAFAGIFPRDNPRDTRFSIIFFTQIGLGPLTEELREFLAAKPTVDPNVTIKEEEEEEKPVIEKKSNKRKRQESSSDSSSDSDSDSSSDSTSDSDSDSDSSSDSGDSSSSSSSDSETSSSSDSDESGSSSSSTPSPPPLHSRSRSTKDKERSTSRYREVSSKEKVKDVRSSSHRSRRREDDKRSKSHRSHDERTRERESARVSERSDKKYHKSTRNERSKRDVRHEDKRESNGDKHRRDTNKHRRDDKYEKDNHKNRQKDR